MSKVACDPDARRDGVVVYDGEVLTWAAADELRDGDRRIYPLAACTKKVLVTLPDGRADVRSAEAPLEEGVRVLARDLVVVRDGYVVARGRSDGGGASSARLDDRRMTAVLRLAALDRWYKYDERTATVSYRRDVNGALAADATASFSAPWTTLLVHAMDHYDVDLEEVQRRVEQSCERAA